MTTRIDEISQPVLEEARRRKERQGRRGLLREAPEIEPPRAIERRYRGELVRFVRAIESDIRQLLIDRIPELEQDRDQIMERADAWDEDVEQIIAQLRRAGSRRSQELIDRLEDRGRDISEWNRSRFKDSVRAVLGVDVFQSGSIDGQWLSVEIRSWARENANLIESIPEQMLTQVEGIAQRGLRGGVSGRDIAKEIRGRFGVTESRARLIARDQVSKLNGQITKARNERLGVDMYIWRTSEDERVRESHRVMNGRLCRWDDATVYSDDGGETWMSRSSIGGYEGHVGEDYQCRCGSSPQLDAVLDRLESEG